MTVIEIRPHRWGWKVFEAPGSPLMIFKHCRELRHSGLRCTRGFPKGPQPALQFPHFTRLAWERTITHLSPRFTKTSVQTVLPLQSCPRGVLFSVALPWTTATFSNTFTSIGPISKDS